MPHRAGDDGDGDIPGMIERAVGLVEGTLALLIGRARRRVELEVKDRSETIEERRRRFPVIALVRQQGGIEAHGDNAFEVGSEFSDIPLELGFKFSDIAPKRKTTPNEPSTRAYSEKCSDSEDSSTLSFIDLFLTQLKNTFTRIAMMMPRLHLMSRTSERRSAMFISRQRRYEQ